MLAYVQIQPDFLPAWQRIITRYSTGYAGGGVVYENGLVLPPYRDGTSLSPNLLFTLSFFSLSGALASMLFHKRHQMHAP